MSLIRSLLSETLEARKKEEMNPTKETRGDETKRDVCDWEDGTRMLVCAFVLL